MSNVWTYVNSLTKVLLPRVWRGLRHWNTVEDRLLEYIKKRAIEGDTASVLAAMDKFMEEQWMMCIEYKKRAKIEEVLMGTSPKVCLELGTYCGYSATVMGNCLRVGSRLITVEKNDKTSIIAKQIIKFAGLDQVTVFTGKSKDIIQSLRSNYSVDKLDFVFIDHWKSQYLPDLKRLEENQLLRKGTVVVADNTLWPGTPDYLKYVESCGKYKTERVYFAIDIFNVQDIVTISVYTGSDQE